MNDVEGKVLTVFILANEGEVFLVGPYRSHVSYDVASEAQVCRGLQIVRLPTIV